MEIIKSATWEATFRYQIETHRANAEAMKALREKGVKIHRTPDSVLKGQLAAWKEIADKAASENPFFKKVLESQKKCASIVIPASSKSGEHDSEVQVSVALRL